MSESAHYEEIPEASEDEYLEHLTSGCTTLNAYYTQAENGKYSTSGIPEASEDEYLEYWMS
jgi:hypothetical protein